MSYKLKIGTSTFADEFDNDGSWSQTVVRDFREKLLRVRGNYNFTAWDGLYDLIYTNAVANGQCTAQEGKVFFRGECADAYEEIWRGEMKPQDAEFDLVKGSVNTQILDNTWSAKFFNSQDQSIFLRGTTSKNGVAIQGCANISCQFFDPTVSTLATYLPDLRLCFRVYEVFKYFVRYYTDDTVTFESDFFDVGGDGDQYYITTGKEIRTHDGSANPEISFSEAFSEMDKKLNLWIIIEGTPSAPVLRIEPRGYSLDEDISIEVENPEGILMKTDLDLLYTEINVGSRQTDYDESEDANYRNVPFTSWNDESYNTPGDCEFENNTLDLVSTWKIDTNSIEQALNVNIANEDFDDDIFLIEIDPQTPFTAFKFTDAVTDVTNPDAYYLYNFNLTNQQVLNNWFDSIPQEVVKAVTKDYYMYADTIAGSGSGFPRQNARYIVAYSNDTVLPGSDSDGLYDPVTGRLTVEVSGLYDIDTSVKVTHPSSYDVTLSITALSSGGTFPTDEVLRQRIETLTGVTGNQTLNGSASLYLEAGWEIVIEVDVTNTLYYDTVGHFDFQAHTPVIQEGATNPLTYLYDIQKFQLSQADFDTVTANKEKRIRFKDTKTGREWKLWPKEMTYSHRLGEVITGEFIGYAPENPLCWVLDGEFDRGFWDDFCYWVDEYGWIDCSSTVVSNPDITGNPVGTWSLLLGTTQTGERTFTDPAGGPVYDVYLRQTIELPAGTYTLYSSASISAVDTTWGGEFTLTGASGLGSLWTSTDLSETTATTFTVTGSSTRTFTARFAANIGASPTYTINQINIC